MGTIGWILVVGAGLLAGGTARADAGGAQPEWMRFLDNDYYKVHLTVRPRVELADQDGRDFSHAWTVRTRLGLESKPFHGFSALAEAEGTFAFSTDTYWDVVSPPNGRTPVPDPQFIELNRAWGRYRNRDLLGLDLKGGRQRIVYDDSRFVGNVGWRQNEQTFDSARAITTLGLDGFSAEYVYLWQVRRIFAGRGSTAGTAHWDADSHLVRLRYEGFAPLKVTAFAYLLDLETAPGFSSNSYGFRATGSRELSDTVDVDYVASYAFQTDAGDNPVGYRAHYVNAEGAVGVAKLGKLGLGYELLGSDDGAARFVTPLATLHKFNGFADVFLDNGGPNGLQDFYLYYAPPLPWGLKGRAIYHHFRSDQGNDTRGNEIDFVVAKKLGEHMSVLSKGAWFDAAASDLRDTWRLVLQFEFKL